MKSDNKKITNRKIVIWGTGFYGSRFAVKLGRDNFDYYIDKNPKHSMYLGKPVVSPDDIKGSEWKSIFVYVPFNYYNEIKDYLQVKGLKENVDFVSYDSRLEFSEEHAINDYCRYKEEVSKKGVWSDKTVIWGRFWVKKEYLDFFSQMKKMGVDFALVSEAVWMVCGEAEQLLSVPSVTAPCFADEESIVIGSVNEYERSEMSDSLKHQEMEHLKGIHKGEYSELDYDLSIQLIYDYVDFTVRMLDIKRIICTGSTMVSHIILSKICRDNNIQIIYTHQGIIPGTIAFDTIGEVGESVSALYPDQCCKLLVSEQEINKTNEILAYLKLNGMNRKVMPRNTWKEDVINRIAEGKHIILYAGQNDVFSHMVPYTEKTQKFYSPIFESSEDALFFLAELCQKNGWNIIYKPHPMYVNRTRPDSFPDNVIYVPFGNINEMIDYCDVMITILSTSNYISLIRNKPVVMLGYNQIKGKGCTYEAFEKEHIEEKIKDALKYGFSSEQQSAFVKHVARSLKYYLYDDLQHKELEYGKHPPSCMDDFYELERKAEKNGIL